MVEAKVVGLLVSAIRETGKGERIRVYQVREKFERRAVTPGGANEFIDTKVRNRAESRDFVQHLTSH